MSDSAGLPADPEARVVSASGLDTFARRAAVFLSCRRTLQCLRLGAMVTMPTGLSASPSRRSLLQLVTGTALGALPAALFDRKSAHAGCKKVGKKCDKNKDCCDGARCEGDKKDKKGKCRCKAGLKDCPGKTPARTSTRTKTTAAPAATSAPPVRSAAVAPAPKTACGTRAALATTSAPWERFAPPTVTAASRAPFRRGSPSAMPSARPARSTNAARTHNADAASAPKEAASAGPPRSAQTTSSTAPSMPIADRATPASSLVPARRLKTASGERCAASPARRPPPAAPRRGHRKAPSSKSSNSGPFLAGEGVASEEPSSSACSDGGATGHSSDASPLG